jgi:hypothetical protein
MSYRLPLPLPLHFFLHIKVSVASCPWDAGYGNCLHRYTGRPWGNNHLVHFGLFQRISFFDWVEEPAFQDHLNFFLTAIGSSIFRMPGRYCCSFGGASGLKFCPVPLWRGNLGNGLNGMVQITSPSFVDAAPVWSVHMAVLCGLSQDSPLHAQVSA